ncbi:MAG: NAD-dependent DNA ligase LigA, partial [Lachnospiraceae bacterium]|nr:NAD-dependent DNA ligase LigA [Lachnospiraceae bacterium]
MEKNVLSGGENENNEINRIRELVELLNKASKAYYQDGNEIMTNFEYDNLYDELLSLEKKTGFVMANSPTINVGYEVLSELPKERHDFAMLSLDKTKEVNVLADFLGGHKGVISWKLDGLTVVLTYLDGKLNKAVTRGNGEVGEVITNNAKVFKNIPLSIPYQGELIIRGEAVIKYSDFEKINESIEDVDAKYKNPRNLCSGSVRQLSNEITANRNVNFFAFALIKAEGVDFGNSIIGQFDWLMKQGFEVVEHYEADKENIESRVSYFADAISKNDFPSDGLVLMFDDIEYGNSLGRTSKFPRNGIAFKWKDETAKTKLLDIDWSASRTGLINPVAVFEPVELEGTTVMRASIHNVSVAENLELGIGDSIEVYKANMIIPQIAQNHTRSGLKNVPSVCPVCGEATTIKED